MKTYIAYGISEIVPENFKTPYLWSWRNFGDKPCGGLWASPRDSKHSWKNECQKLPEIEKEFMYPEGFDKAFEKKIEFKIKENARILEINGLLDYLEVATEYMIHLGSEYNWKLKKKDHDIFGIDWEKVAKDYDAIYVSYDGIQEIEENLEKMNTSDKKFLGLGTWAVDSICLCNLECIEEVM